MKYIYVLTLSLLMGWAVQVSAQTRFLSEVFDEVKVTSNIPYATNITVITGAPAPQTLLLDIYEPEDDNAEKRPLIIMFHTGNFLPHPLNQGTGGLKTDSTIVGMARRLAKMGYVVASAEYRLGWNPTAPTQETRVNLLINAAYRGVQDARTCVRFFNKSVADDANPYRIDPERITLWGFGTGGYVTMNTTVLTRYDKTLIPKFIGEDLLPMVKAPVSGDPFGLQQAPLNLPNHVGYSSDFQLCVNLGGAMGDTSWMEPGLQPMISFHVPSDPFAPYVEGIVIVPGLGLPVVEVQGSYLVQQLANQYGNNQVFAAANINDTYTTAANSRNDGYEGLMPLPRAFPLDSSPWDWWSPDNPNHATGLQTNPDMSFAKAMIYADTILGYFAPRAFAALNLAELVSTRNTEFSAADVQMAPNPSSGEVLLFAKNNALIREVQVVDMQGRVVRHFANVNNPYLNISRNNTPDGVYMVQMRMDDGLLVKKLIYR
jgi:dienelactone hydrolase